MPLIATVLLIAGILAAWRLARRAVTRPRLLARTAIAAVAVILLWLLAERLAPSRLVLPWTDWVYFVRIPLHLAITLVLALA